MVHCELATNFTQSTVDFCGIFAVSSLILMYDLWSKIVPVSDTPAGSIIDTMNLYIYFYFLAMLGVKEVLPIVKKIYLHFFYGFQFSIIPTF